MRTVNNSCLDKEGKFGDADESLNPIRFKRSLWWNAVESTQKIQKNRNFTII